jgi:hypothetical protein
MDNGTSVEVEGFIKELNRDVQYTAPGRHCAPAEKAVQTYKSCFKSTPAPLPLDFPISDWCRLLLQNGLYVNISRTCRQNPKLSAWATMEGNFHFDSTPITLPGTTMLIYKRLENKTKYRHNAKKSWYIRPCLNHYQTFKAILSSTGAERMSDTIKMKYHTVAISTLTLADIILKAARQLDSVIK